MEQITTTNLKQYEGKATLLSCVCGLCCYQLSGTLVVGHGFCAYGLKLADGQMIGFGFGKFKLDDETLIVNVQ